MSKRAPLTATVAQELMRNLTGGVPTLIKAEEFRDRINSHDFDNPLARTDFYVDAQKYEVRGNYIAAPSRGKHVHLLCNNQIVTKTDPDYDAWRNALIENGWSFEHTSTSIEKGPAKTFYLHYFGNSAYPKAINKLVLTVPTLAPDGSCDAMHLHISSIYEGPENIKAIERYVARSIACSPGSKDAAIDMATGIIEACIQEAFKEEGLKIPYTITAHNWVSAVVTVTGTNSKLQKEMAHKNVDFQKSATKGITLSDYWTHALSSFLSAQLRRTKKRIKGTSKISGLGQKILGNRDIKQVNSAWHVTEENGVQTMARMIFREGNIGGEAIIDANGKRQLRLLNNTFELPGYSMPQAAITALIGKPLTDLIKHPLVTEDMIIQRIDLSPTGRPVRRVTGRYKDIAKKAIDETP